MNEKFKNQGCKECDFYRKSIPGGHSNRCLHPNYEAYVEFDAIHGLKVGVPCFLINGSGGCEVFTPKKEKKNSKFKIQDLHIIKDGESIPFVKSIYPVAGKDGPVTLDLDVPVHVPNEENLRPILFSDGEEIFKPPTLMLIGCSDENTVTVPVCGNPVCGNVVLAGNEDFTLRKGDVLLLGFNRSTSCWQEMSRIIARTDELSED